MCISVMCIDASGDLPKQISIVTRALASALHEQEGEIAPTASVRSDKAVPSLVERVG